jgi:hypothetical protein
MRYLGEDSRSPGHGFRSWEQIEAGPRVPTAIQTGAAEAGADLPTRHETASLRSLSILTRREPVAAPESSPAAFDAGLSYSEEGSRRWRTSMPIWSRCGDGRKPGDTPQAVSGGPVFLRLAGADGLHRRRARLPASRTSAWNCPGKAGRALGGYAKLGRPTAFAVGAERRRLVRGKRKPWRHHQRTRPRILARDGFRCVYCGKNVSGALAIDHWIPRSGGGRTEPHNLVTACRTCNHREGNNIWPAPIKRRTRARLKGRLRPLYYRRWLVEPRHFL